MGDLRARRAERLGEERAEEEEEEEERRAAAPAPQACPAAGEVAPSPGPHHISAALEWLLQPRLIAQLPDFDFP